MAFIRLAGGASWLVVLSAVACAGGGASPAHPAGSAIAPERAAPADSVAEARARTVRDSTEAGSRLQRGLRELQQGRDSAAALEFAAARRLEPRLVEAIGGLALIEARSNHVAAARVLADSAVALGDTSAYVQQLRGRLLAEQGRCPDAVAVLAPFVRTHAEWTAPRPDLARCYLRLGRASEAVPVMQEAVRREPDAPPLRYALVDAFTATTQLDSALTHARYLTVRYPENGLWWAVTGRVLFLLNRLDEARTSFEWGFRLRPGPADSLAPIDRNAWQVLERLPRQPPR